MWYKRQKYLYLLFLCLLSFPLVVSCSSGTGSPTTDISTHELMVNLPGISDILVVDGFGRLLKNTQITSSDGNVSLTINKNTALLDENKKPLQFIKVALAPAIPVPPQNAEVVGRVFEIQPQGAVANPSLKLTLSYDPSLFPQGSTENDMWVYSYDRDTWDIIRNKQIDAKANRITTTINRFGKYSVLATIKPVETPTPVSQSSLTSMSLKEALSNGKPTLAEFGASTCIPCKQMKPILEKLAVDYEGKLNVVIVEVYEQRELTQQYRIMTIPTQVAFDSTGKEIIRHIGLWPKEQIITQLNKMGIK